MGKLLILLLTLATLMSIISSLPIHSSSEPEAEAEAEAEAEVANLEKGTMEAKTTELYPRESNQNEASSDHGDDDDKWQKYQEEDYDEYDEDDDDSDDEGICLFCRRDYLKEPPVDLVCGHRFHLPCLNLYKRNHGLPLKCPLCKKHLDIEVKENGPSLEELFYQEDLKELIRNKLKIGLQAGRELMPSDWEHIPKKFDGESLY